MLSCAQLLDELSNYLDDQTAADVRRNLEAHLEDCGACRVLLDSTRKTIRITSRCGSFELPASLSARIMARVRASKV